MIIQTSNQPIIVTFDESPTNFSDFRVTLWKGTTNLKTWTASNTTIDDNSIICPLTQAETKDFPAGIATIEIKWMDEEDTTGFGRIVRTEIVPRNDKTLLT